jgi:hypothetical protein
MCNFALDKAYGYWTVSVAVQGLVRVPIVSFNPDVIDRNLDGRKRVWRPSEDRIPFKSNDALNSSYFGVGWTSVIYD